MILQYDTRIANSYPGVFVSAQHVLVNKTDCGGLAVDTFGNLFYADTKNNSISLVKFKDFKDHFYNKSQEPISTQLVYSSDTAPTKQVLNLHIDKDYLYWTNSATEIH